MESIIKPHPRWRSAKQIVMLRERAPYLAGVFQLGPADFKLFERNALAVEHPINVVIRLHEQLRWIGKRLVARKPGSLGVTMRTDDGQVANARIDAAGNRARIGIRRKEPFFMNQGHRYMLILFRFDH